MQVVRMRVCNGSDGGRRQHWLRRQAAFIVSELPEDDQEALAILEWARRLIEFLGAPTRVS
jgi:hypothetical protein